MDLIVCPKCAKLSCAFSDPRIEQRKCPDCRGETATVRRVTTQSPDPPPASERALPGDGTLVELRRKNGLKEADQILSGLSEHFDIADGGSVVRVVVDRVEAEEASLRVAAVLEDIDILWHLYLEWPRLATR